MQHHTQEAGSVIRVLIVDDHSVVREGLTAIIHRQKNMEVVALASSAQEAQSQFRIYRPDITLMDLRLPDQDGLEAMIAIRKEAPAARFIILTTYAEEEHIFRAVRGGARGFFEKDASRADLINAIQTVAAGGVCLTGRIGEAIAKRMNRAALTNREMDVLKLMAEGCSNQEIGARLFIEESTVKSHINTMLRKMDVSDRTQAVVKALERGLITLSASKANVQQAN